MKAETTIREKILLTGLPAVVVLTGYLWAFGNPKRAELRQVQEKLSKAVASAVSPGKIIFHRDHRAALKREIGELQSKQADLRRQADELCGRVAEPRKSVDALQTVVDIFKRHGVKLIGEEAVDGQRNSHMSASLDQAVAELAGAFAADESAEQHDQSGTHSRLRRLHLHGQYPNVLRALEELAKSRCQVVPVSMAMGQVGVLGMYSDDRDWTLLLRI